MTSITGRTTKRQPRPHTPHSRPKGGRSTGPRLGSIWAILVVGCIWLGGCGSATKTDERLPDVETTRLEVDAAGAGTAGQPISLADLDGPAVINVWSTTCAPCVREMPALQSVADSRPDVAFYGLNLAESPTAVADFVDRVGVTYDQLLDPDGYAQEALAIDSLPTTIVIGSDGTISKRHRGEITADDLEAVLDES